MTFPWEQCDFHSEVVPDAKTGLYPGQQHPLDVPDFIRTFRASLSGSLPTSNLSVPPPWAAKS